MSNQYVRVIIKGKTKYNTPKFMLRSTFMVCCNDNPEAVGYTKYKTSKHNKKYNRAVAETYVKYEKEKK